MSAATITAVKPESLSWEKKGLAFAALLAIGGILTAISLILGFVPSFGLQKDFAFAWLFAFSFFFTICSGALFWVLVHHATDAAWSTAVRRVFENVACLFQWLWLVFIPVFIFRADIWSWLGVKAGESASLDAKTWWFGMGAGLTDAGHNLVFVRWVGILLYMGVVATLLRHFSTSQDRDGDPKWTFRTRQVTYLGIFFFAFAFTAGVVDWLMALDYTWFSTMWGVYLFAGSAWSSMATAVLITAALQSTGHLKVVSKEHYHIMGKFMFAFTVFWAYIAYDQYMLIWYANIPEETSYFLRRNTGSWHTLSTLLMVGHFIIPFFFLLPRFGKKNLKYIVAMATYVLTIHALDHFIIIMPILHPQGVDPISVLLSLVTVGGIGCLLAALVLHNLGSHRLFPARDPRIIESIGLVN